MTTLIADDEFFTDPRNFREKLAAEERSWMPHKPEEDCPVLLAGLVIERGAFISSYDGDDQVPTMRVLTADNVEWSVIAFHGWLRAELERHDPHPGDFVALAYKGTKPARTKGDNDAYVYKLVVVRNPDPTPKTFTTAGDVAAEAAGEQFRSELADEHDDEEAFIASLGQENPFPPAGADVEAA
jgi:hypothetical protein